MTTALNAGLEAFRGYMAEAVEAGKGKTWRAGGRATKAMPNKEDGTWWGSNGPSMVQGYYQWRLKNPTMSIWHTADGVPAIELEINVTLPGGIVLKCFIDRIFQDPQGNLMIVDLKTGKEPTNALQLATYALAVKQQFGIDIKYGSYWMAREAKLGTIHDLDFMPRDMVARWIRDVDKAIKAEIFVPNLTSWCNSCGLQKSCYAYGEEKYKPSFNSDLEESNE
jgi:hypothetical protein